MAEKTNDHNIPTIFEKKEKPKAGKKNAENKDDQTKNDKKSNAIMEPFERKISVRLLARKLPIIPPPAPSPKPQPTKKPPARATQPKKAPGKAKTMNVARTRSARNQRATKVIVKPPSPPPEIKEEPEPIKVGSTALIRFIREDHLYCLPKADNPGSLQKLLEEKAKVVETLLEKIHSLELELEEKDLNLKRVQEELRKAQSIIAQQWIQCILSLQTLGIDVGFSWNLTVAM